MLYGYNKSRDPEAPPAITGYACDDDTCGATWQGWTDEQQRCPECGGTDVSEVD